VQTGRVDGLIVASARPRSRLIAALRKRPVPHVFVNRAVPRSHRNVTTELEAASLLAVRQLAQLGHTRIGHVAGPHGIYTAMARERGFLVAAKKVGLVAPPVRRGAFSEQGGAEAAAALLADTHVTALYVSSLSQAIGVLHAARAVGRSVPADLSVISFDDLPLAANLNPPLTAIGMPLQELGAAAVDSLMEQLRGDPPRDVVVSTPLLVVERSSTAPPPS